ncbi:hypothetical protein DVR12_20285 [Chitinophaga silvatica]|uniref:Intracellular protease/amidase n=1 Tax=Chitinophaga silvatica TaxID=2282649 RepID=A0A3E1Y5S2_9BACT|nr:type 1 glutamine amidotransferase domain-containing protein [Chitinophaga silvatica]RFS20062.1 hypothetical protein DVR12_20285 [Chitinophaga silvatica]
MSVSPLPNIKRKVLIPLPDYGFDPTEAAIPWSLLTANGHEVYFATPSGYSSMCDMRILRGTGLGIWKPFLMAGTKASLEYNYMSNSDTFCNPYKYTSLHPEEFDALLLPGGHDKAIKEYLESPILQEIIADYFVNSRPVAAICHGVLLVARSMNPLTQKSVLFNYKTTALLTKQERMAYQLTRLWLKDYYLTYPISVQDEVTSLLASPSQFIEGPLPMLKDSITHPERGFSLLDRHYLSARWPGDVYHFANAFLEMLK